MISEESLNSIFFYTVDLLGIHFAFPLFLIMVYFIALMVSIVRFGVFSWKFALKATLITIPFAIPCYWLIMIAHYDDVYKLPFKTTTFETNWWMGMFAFGIIGLLFIFAVIKYIVKDRNTDYSEYFMKDKKE